MSASPFRAVIELGNPTLSHASTGKESDSEEEDDADLNDRDREATLAGSHHPARQRQESPIKEDSELLRSQRDAYLQVFDARKSQSQIMYPGAPDNVGGGEIMASPPNVTPTRSNLRNMYEQQFQTEQQA